MKEHYGNRVYLGRVQRSPIFVMVCIAFILSFSLLISVAEAAEVTLDDLAEPDTGEEWFLVGNVFLDAGEYEDAIGSWHNAMTMDPSYSADAWYNIGLAYVQAEMFEDALHAWIQSLEYNPSNAAAYDNIATTYVLLGMPKEALTAYNLAILSDPIEAKYTEDRDLFIENMKKSASEDDEGIFSRDQWDDVGMILHQEGDIEGAHKAWDKGLISSENAQNTGESAIIAKIWKNKAIVYMEQEDYTAAVDAWLNSIEMQATGSAYNDLGYCYIVLEMPEKALDAFDNALALEPESESFIENKNNLLTYFPELLDEEGE